MSRRSNYRAGMLPDAEGFALLVLALVVTVVFWATGWGTAILGWAGDLLLDQVEKIGNTQPE